MITPTRAAVIATAAGAPVALLVGVVAPGSWIVGLAWPLAVLLLAGVDALLGGRSGTLSVEAPATACVGATVEIAVTVAVPGVRAAEVAVELGPELEAEGAGGSWLRLDEGPTRHVIAARAVRRGTARVNQAWLRWRGPIGLVWRQRVFPLATAIAVLPDIRPVRDSGARLIRREAIEGLMVQHDRSDGADFDSLVEFQTGMDRRAIDWKQSARHLKLNAKQFRAERNNQIVFAIDAGRQMAEPVAGLSRLDRVVSAMLLTAWIAIKLGDRVALHAFDSRPRIASGLVSGGRAFPEIQRLAARIDYSGEETNYTFALTSLAGRLTRRSLIVLFTEFADRTSAEFLVRAAERLMRTHLLLLVVLRDEELETIEGRAPETADDVTRAVTAAALLRDRLTVITQLQRMGAHVIEAPHDRVGERLVAGYVDLKRRNLL